MTSPMTPGGSPPTPPSGFWGGFQNIVTAFLNLNKLVAVIADTLSTTWGQFVVGPSSSTDNALVRWDGMTGKLQQDSQVTLSDTTGLLARTGGISVQGTNTNDSASAGYFGEYASVDRVIGSANSLSTGVPLNVNSLSLTAGDWWVWINGGFTGAAGTTVSYVECSMSTNSGSLSTINGFIGLEVYNSATIFAHGNPNVVVGPCRMSLAAGSTTVYFVAQAAFGVSTLSVYGVMQARRAR